MRVLICHNFYQQGGGEDQVFAAEAELLRAHGHDVDTFSIRNDQIETMGKLKLAAATIWNSDSAGIIRDRVKDFEPQVVHFHNTFPLLSPAVYSAARDAGAAVVQTLHNYRLLCVAATLFRNGAPCEKCVGHTPLAGVLHSCYRGSKAASAVAAATLAAHRALGTYARHIDAFIPLTTFARNKFMQAGFDASRLHLKPNFIDPDPGPGQGAGNYALFVGRLCEEKGIRPLLAAWKIIGGKLPLKIIGDGPLADEVRREAATNPSIEWLGKQTLATVIHHMGDAAVLVFPSLWYEGFPRTIVESYARGTPVAASDLGSMIELIEDNKTGIRFKPGDPENMAQKIQHLIANSALAEMRTAAREKFLTSYTATQNHTILIDIYHQAIDRRHLRSTIQVPVTN
jgi:glycosyltransferase involved in cell wall biosynthesis